MVGMATFFFGTWINRLYLAAVAAAAVSGSQVLLTGLTSPVSIIFAPVFLLGEGWLTTPMYAGSVLAGCLLNTVVLNLICGPAQPGGPTPRGWAASRPRDIRRAPARRTDRRP
jgi:hypothetical protein